MVIDAHLHLWDVARHRYEWLQRPENSAIRRTFGFADFAARAAAAGVDRAVLVQADDDSADTEAMFEVARERRRIAGVVGWVPLDRPGEAAGAAAVGRVGLALLERRGVPFDVISVLPRHLAHVPVLSERYPGLRTVLDHLARPPLGRDDWEPWRTLLRAAAVNPLVYAKVSGLYPPRAEWTAGDIRPLRRVHDRAVRPPPADVRQRRAGRRAGPGYPRVRPAISSVLGELPPADRDAVLGGTARDFYQLGEAE